MSYQKALADFISDDLGGEIAREAWPVEGANTTLGAADAGDDDDDDADDGADNDAGNDDDADAGASDDDADGAADDDADAGADEELPNTGRDSWMWFIVALTIAAGGAMVWFEARRASVRSLATRLVTTRPWNPEDDHS